MVVTPPMVPKMMPVATLGFGIQRSKRFGTPNVWLRQTKHSMPIDVLVTPSLSEVLVKKKINSALARRARERFAAVFEQAANRQKWLTAGR